MNHGRSTQVRAAVAWVRRTLRDSVTYSRTAPCREVLVQVVSAGICHTDAVARAGDYPVPTPVVFGHEGTGLVDVGDAVDDIVIGDHGNARRGRPIPLRRSGCLSSLK